MAATPHRDLETVPAGELEGAGDVAGTRAPGDNRRSPVDQAVEDLAGGVVVGVVGLDHLTLERDGELLHRHLVGQRLGHRASSRPLQLLWTIRRRTPPALLERPGFPP